MYFRYPVKFRAVVKYASLALLYLCSCTLLYLSSGDADVVPSATAAEPPAKPVTEKPVTELAPQPVGYVVDTALTPGVGHTAYTLDPRAAKYYDNQEAVTIGKALFYSMNCAGCHSNGGGGMGPSLMDNQWIYGGRLEQIRQTIADGRPNGMPSWGARLSDADLWRLAAYVRSMSLPATLAAQGSGNPSQSPAPVPRAADEDAGWSAPAGTTNDYTTTLKGPK
jgi:cytochrome c oxidase cbb3-type subunit III